MKNTKRKHMVYYVVVMRKDDSGSQDSERHLEATVHHHYFQPNNVRDNERYKWTHAKYKDRMSADSWQLQRPELIVCDQMPIDR